MHRIERAVMLNAIDTWWIRHLTALDELRTGISLRAFGQQDPLVTFKREGFAMFDTLKAHITDDIVHGVFQAEPAESTPTRPRPMDRVRAGRGALMAQAQAQTAAAATLVPQRSGEKLGRNDPCHCGSGKKYKHCHMRLDGPGGAAPVAVQARPARRRR
jgi:preprotein translocase subunit SecA